MSQTPPETPDTKPTAAPLRREYSQEDVEAILKRAVSVRENFNRGQLESMATELNISPQELAIAEEQWLAERDREARGAFVRERLLGAWSRVGWWLLAGVALILAFLSRVSVLVLFSRNSAIPYFIILAILLLFALVISFQRNGDWFDTAYERWLRQQQKRKERAAARRDLLS